MRRGQRQTSSGIPRYVVRIIAIAIPTAALILLLSASSVSFAQRTSPTLFVAISHNTIDPGETVSIRVFATQEPNSTRHLIFRFLPPEGPGQYQQFLFRADPVGFASQIINYPKDIANASTNHHGNYTVLIQDMQTGTLQGETSFEVVQKGFLVSCLSPPCKY